MTQIPSMLSHAKNTANHRQCLVWIAGHSIHHMTLCMHVCMGSRRYTSYQAKSTGVAHPLARLRPVRLRLEDVIVAVVVLPRLIPQHIEGLRPVAPMI